MTNYEKEKDEYICLIKNTYDHLYRNIHYPTSCCLHFFPKNDFANDFTYVDSEEKHTVVFKTIKPETTISIYKSKNMSKVSIRLEETRMEETGTITGFDNALDKMIQRIEKYINNKI